MTDYFREAEKLLKPQQVPVGFHALNPEPGSRTETLPADRAAAQVHATLAVAEQLSRIATALERIARGQDPR
jgi:hypothetical protein